MSGRVAAISLACGLVALSTGARAEELASTAPAPVSAGIITPAFVDDLRKSLVQPVTILSVHASNIRHQDVRLT